MNPHEISECLNIIASVIDENPNPSRISVASDLRALIAAVENGEHVSGEKWDKFKDFFRRKDRTEKGGEEAIKSFDKLKKEIDSIKKEVQANRKDLYDIMESNKHAPYIISKAIKLGDFTIPDVEGKDEINDFIKLCEGLDIKRGAEKDDAGSKKLMEYASSLSDTLNGLRADGMKLDKALREGLVKGLDKAREKTINEAEKYTELLKEHRTEKGHPTKTRSLADEEKARAEKEAKKSKPKNRPKRPTYDI